MDRLPGSARPGHDTTNGIVHCQQYIPSCQRILPNGSEYLQHLRDRHRVELQSSDYQYYKCLFKSCYVEHSSWDQLCEHMKHHLGDSGGSTPCVLHSSCDPVKPHSILSMDCSHINRRPRQDVPQDVPIDIDDMDLSAAMPSVEPPSVRRYLQRRYGFPASSPECEEQDSGPHIDSMLLRQGMEAQLRRQTRPIRTVSRRPQEQKLEAARHEIDESVKLMNFSSSVPPLYASDPPSALGLSLDYSLPLTYPGYWIST